MLGNLHFPAYKPRLKDIGALLFHSIAIYLQSLHFYLQSKFPPLKYIKLISLS